MKEDRLNFILDRLIDFEGHVDSNTLHQYGLYDEFNDDSKKINSDFKGLQNIFYKSGASEEVYGQDPHLICYCRKTVYFKENYGSFENYYISIKEKEIESQSEIKKQKIRQEKEEKKLDIDIYLGEFEKKQGTKFKQWGFVIVVVNLIIVLSGIFISTQANKQSENLEPDQLLRIEKKISKLENQILILERKNDSLNYQEKILSD
ncbi:hypothetical protein V6246_18095 [Algibacter sp. TI.3.09]|uniref:hypothetical protein n=1 Tax=Algibacter sp. TI.3.09 TaxID=3121298 RepID=UPI00311F8104